jgi:hypothetical protein
VSLAKGGKFKVFLTANLYDTIIPSATFIPKVPAQ